MVIFRKVLDIKDKREDTVDSILQSLKPVLLLSKIMGQFTYEHGSNQRTCDTYILVFYSFVIQGVQLTMGACVCGVIWKFHEYFFSPNLYTAVILTCTLSVVSEWYSMFFRQKEYQQFFEKLQFYSFWSYKYATKLEYNWAFHRFCCVALYTILIGRIAVEVVNRNLPLAYSNELISTYVLLIFVRLTVSIYRYAMLANLLHQRIHHFCEFLIPEMKMHSPLSFTGSVPNQRAIIHDIKHIYTSLLIASQHLEKIHSFALPLWVLESVLYVIYDIYNLGSCLSPIYIFELISRMSSLLLVCSICHLTTHKAKLMLLSVAMHTSSTESDNDLDLVDLGTYVLEHRVKFKAALCELHLPTFLLIVGLIFSYCILLYSL